MAPAQAPPFSDQLVPITPTADHGHQQKDRHAPHPNAAAKRPRKSGERLSRTRKSLPVRTSSNHTADSNRNDASPSDPRRIRTRRANSVSAWRSVCMSLSTAPYLHVLLCNFTYQPRLLGLWPPSTFFVVYSASNPDAGWSRVAYVDKLPLVVRLPCLSSEVFSRTLRVCVFARQGGTGGRELGTCSVAIRDLLDPARISGGSGGGGPLMAPVEGSSVSAAGKGRARERVGMLEVRGVVATGRAGEGLHIIVRAGISMRKEMRSCLLRVWRVGGGRQTVQLGEGRCASGVFEDVVVERDVLWFGLGESDAPNAGVRLEFRGGSRRLWTAGRDRDVLGTVELSMERLRKLRERDVVPVAWRGGGGMRCLVVDAVDVGGGLASLQMTLTR